MGQPCLVLLWVLDGGWGTDYRLLPSLPRPLPPSPSHQAHLALASQSGRNGAHTLSPGDTTPTLGSVSVALITQRQRVQNMHLRAHEVFGLEWPGQGACICARLGLSWEPPGLCLGRQRAVPGLGFHPAGALRLARPTPAFPDL